jgi:hypothetical protein
MFVANVAGPAEYSSLMKFTSHFISQSSHERANLANRLRFPKEFGRNYQKLI